MYGFHISKEKRNTTYDALKEDIKKYSILSTQIFVVNPRSSKPIKLGKLDDINKFINKNKINLYVHSSYVTVSFWNKSKYGLDTLLHQMNLAKKIGAKGFVLHLPKKTCEHITKILKENVKKINKTNIRLMLEHPVFKSDKECSYEMPFQLNRLTKNIDKIGLKNWGYTIDTAHLWSSITKEDRKEGFTIETYKGADKWLKSLTKNTRRKIKLIHLNGSHNLCCSNKDKHAIPIYGKITDRIKGEEMSDNMWKKYSKEGSNIKKSGLYRFLKFAKTKKISVIIEMNAGTTDQLIKSLKIIHDNLS